MGKHKKFYKYYLEVNMPDGYYKTDDLTKALKKLKEAIEDDSLFYFYNSVQSEDGEWCGLGGLPSDHDNVKFEEFKLL